MQSSRTTTLALATLLLSASALAQNYIHGYGGATVIPSDSDSEASQIVQGHSYIVGGGLELGRAYLGLEHYGLIEGHIVSAVLDDLGVASKASGFNVAAGRRLVKTGKFSLIPVAFLGRTRDKACLNGVCEDVLEGIVEQLNYGAGMHARVMVSGKAGLHVGFRYTRHYGAAFSLGLAFGGW